MLKCYNFKQSNRLSTVVDQKSRNQVKNQPSKNTSQVDLQSLKRFEGAQSNEKTSLLKTN